ncbi:hypothetical protein [Chryseobacterium sp. JK1]|uniref:hypothetical protein n=1 Tax=Chryseobacterium sp. JK1 TaxID=874294 RepID=UPI003D68D61A
MKNEYYDTLNLKSDEKVLEIYRDRNRYVKEAQEALIEILKSRNLYEQAIEEEELEYIEQEELEQETIQDFERNLFGKYFSNIEFAQNCLNSGEYFKADFSVIQKSFVLSRLAIVIGMLGAISFCMFLIIHRYNNDLILYWATPSLLLSLLIIVGIKGQKSTKSSLRLVRKSNLDIDLTIQMKDHQITVNYPFKYEYYWTYRQNVKPRIRQVELFIFIYERDEMIISLNETLDASKTPPPHWDFIPDEKMVTKSKFSFTNYAFKSPNLYKLQKILDGLKEQH